MPPQSLRAKTPFDNLRQAERVARAELLTGCANDASRIEQFFERTLGIVRCEAIAAFEPKSFDRIGSDFAQLACANVALRLRARFRIYTNALAQAEAAIASKIALPRMFPIRRPAIAEVRVPLAPVTANDIERWTQDLQEAVVVALRARIDSSLSHVLLQGTHRLCVVKARIDLAQQSSAR